MDMVKVKSKYPTDLSFRLPNNQVVMIQGADVTSIIGEVIAKDTIVRKEEWDQIEINYKDSVLLKEDHIIAVSIKDDTEDVNHDKNLTEGIDIDNIDDTEDVNHDKNKKPKKQG
ncbi:MAG: hypothetical protein ACRC31_06200 [Cetobacterium sp.]